jgi:hypothetical protein
MLYGLNSLSGLMSVDVCSTMTPFETTAIPTAHALSRFRFAVSKSIAMKSTSSLGAGIGVGATRRRSSPMSIPPTTGRVAMVSDQWSEGPSYHDKGRAGDHDLVGLAVMSVQ